MRTCLTRDTQVQWKKKKKVVLLHVENAPSTRKYKSQNAGKINNETH